MRPGRSAGRVTAAVLAGVVAGVVGVAGLAGVARATEAPPASRSPANASYRIEVRLDAEARRLEGRQVLTWRNLQAEPTDELWFHLYWNAWRNDRSTWMLEDRVRGRSSRGKEVRPEDWGWVRVTSARWLGPVAAPDVARAVPGIADANQDAAGVDPDVAGTAPDGVDATGGAAGAARETAGADGSLPMRYASPDDGNPDDRTVLVLSLPRPVAPGETIQVEMTFEARIPRTFARTGFHGDFFFVAHWFPAVGVYEADGWNCHQFHAATEFFSDYGSYDVLLTVPRRHVVGATGQQVERSDNDDGSVSYRFRQDDVHTFTWTASPEYQVREAVFEEPGLPPIAMRLLIQPEHLSQAERHFQAARAAFKYFGTWFGPYPYGHVTLVDPAYRSGAGGMEYPTLFTCGTRLFNPAGGDSPEGVTIHEAGHQFWYGVVGNNEFEHAWIDEGFNTYATIRTLEQAYPPRVRVRRFVEPPGGGRGFFALRVPEIPVSRWDARLARYRPNALGDDPALPTYLYHPRTASNISYSKTALWLLTLERYLGWETLQPILATFYQRHAYGHPTPEDFLTVVDELAGQDLDWFFDQVYRDSRVFDYAVESVVSLPREPEGWIERDGEMQQVEREGDDEGGAADIDPGDDDATSRDAGADVDVDVEQDGGEATVRDRAGTTAGERDDGLPSAGGDDAGDRRIDGGARRYRNEVIVKRLGDGVFPVEVLLVFDDGHRERHAWDGVAHWKRIVVEREARLERAVIDPDRTLMLDVSFANNTRLRDPEPDLPAAKWASRWMVWLQDLMQTMAFFI